MFAYIKQVGLVWVSLPNIDHLPPMLISVLKESFEPGNVSSAGRGAPALEKETGKQLCSVQILIC